MPNNKIILSDRTQVRYCLRSASPLRNNYLRQKIRAGHIQEMYLNDEIPVLILFRAQHEKCLIEKDDFFFDGLPANEQLFFSVDVSAIENSTNVSVVACQHMPALGRHRNEYQILSKTLSRSMDLGNEIQAAIEDAIALMDLNQSVA